MANWNTNDYIDVQERINRFWNEYPTGSIVTTLMSLPDNFDACRYEAKVYQFRTDPIPTAVGYAQEFRLTEGRGVNVTSHEENCETSAIGRALANMGYATKLSERPSRQEMDKVERTLAADNLPARTRTEGHNTIPGGGEPITEPQLKKIGAMKRTLNLSDEKIKEMHGKPSATQLTKQEATALIDKLVVMERENERTLPAGQAQMMPAGPDRTTA